MNRKSRVLGGETADQWEKGIASSGNQKSRVFGGETADQLGKMDRWLREPEVTCFGMETAEERGLKVQSPILASGVGIKRQPQG